MTKRMLIDATHAEETRVVVLDGTRLDDFDIETQARRQLKGNIYLAKVVRVEPSLQAAFVEYGGNRHGFLAFGEIHPDYYQIPVADRQRLLQMQEEEARAEEEDEFGDDDDAPRETAALNASGEVVYESPVIDSRDYTETAADTQPEFEPGYEPAAEAGDLAADQPDARPDHAPEDAGYESTAFDDQPVQQDVSPQRDDGQAPADNGEERLGSRVEEIPAETTRPPETIGGESEQAEDTVRERRQPSRYLRNYKIQEVIRRRQIMLIQVVKEERGTKGAALTTYISLAGRFCVLMPNSPRGGGISRKITSATDRRRLKEVTQELEIPRGMGLIVRTAGANRPKPEIKRDCEYLLRLWDEIRDLTMRSVAPALIYEEASLIKRAIRDVYSRDVDEILVDGEEGWKAARDFMRMLMPTHVKKVQLWRDGGAPLFARQMVEAQLDAMLSPTVQLRSGGYLVINQTEALVAIDVNSGRSTRERGIEETAYRTNMEAADEVARQLRLRDLAGLIVIDFIDMESKKNVGAVERRLKEALKNDRARIQVGNISHFGLMEMSRQRLRPSLAETSLTTCPHCMGMGHVRSTDSAALHALRTIEEEGSKRRSAEILVHMAGPVAFYILNNKRQRLADIEARYGMKINFAPDEALLQGETRIERLRALAPQDVVAPPQRPLPQEAFEDEEVEPTAAELADDADVDAGEPTDQEAQRPGETAEEAEGRRRRRRRRRRGGRREEGAANPMPFDAEQPVIDDAAVVSALPDRVLATVPQVAPAEASDDIVVAEAEPVPVAPAPTEGEADEAKPARGRGQRGGRRRRRPEGAPAEAEAEAPPPPVAIPVYAGPTPANPFGDPVLDIFDVIDAVVERTETARAEARAPRAPKPAPAPASAELPLVAPEPVAEIVPEVPAEPVSAPVIAPIVIGATETTGEKKKGWWRK